jgi:hypothetical protein
MKNKLLTIFFMFTLLLGHAQTDFKWEKIDSVPKTKSQIYSDTKMFIAENWKSAQNVIQNDDKDAGMILLKGVNVQSRVFQMNEHKWTYSYVVKFFMKEGRYKIVIDNVTCVSAVCGAYNWPLIEACDSCEFPGYTKTSLNKERYTELLSSLKDELQRIVDKYEKSIKTPSQSNSDW